MSKCLLLIALYSLFLLNCALGQLTCNGQDAGTSFERYVDELIKENFDGLELRCIGEIGSIPKKLKNLSFLQVLHLNGTISGTLATEIGLLSELREFTVINRNNRNGGLRNSLPRQLGNLVKLNTLRIDSHQITGLIPNQLGNLVELVFLSLRMNQLSGGIPPSLGKLSKLERIILRDNILNGKIPNNLGWNQMDSIDFERNRLEGEIPGSLSSRLELLLGDNMLSGNIPKELLVSTDLQKITLGNNRLNGTIPSELQSLQNLELLSLANEDLDITCDRSLLDWYPDVARFVVDRTSIRCSEINAYGELQLSPHTLRADTEAPATHASFRAPETFSRSIRIVWEYDDTMENDMKIDSSFLSDFTTFQYQINSTGSDELAKFRRCVTFYKPEPTSSDSGTSQKYFGFRVEWESDSMTTNTECFLADELTKNNGYEVVLNDLTPATEHEIVVTPFFIYFESREETAQPVFGIASAELYSDTLEDAPDASPENIRVVRRESRSLEFEWDTLDDLYANGEVLGYNVFCENCVVSSYTRVSSSIVLEQLVPSQEYTILVRAFTSIGPGPWSKNLTTKTCGYNTESVSSELACQAVIGYFTNGESDIQACEAYPFQINQSFCFVEGLQASGLVLEAGWWRPNINNINDDDLLPCPNPSFCDASNRISTQVLMESDIHCADYHTGPYCSGCTNNHTLSKYSGCVQCSSEDSKNHKTKVILAFVFILLIIVLCAFGMVCTSGLFGDKFQKCRCKPPKSKNSRMGYFKSFRNRLGIKLRILFGFLQVFHVIRDSLSANLPSENTSSVSSVLNSIFIELDIGDMMQVLEVQCYIELSYYQTLLLYTLFPISVLSFFGVIYLALSRKFPTFEENLRQKFLWITFLVTFLAYPGVSQKIFEVYLCEDINFPHGSESYLIADYAQSCEPTSERIGWLSYASIMFLLYPLGILILYIFFLLRYKNIIVHPSGYLNENNKLKRVEALILPYKTDYFWFEVYELIRKLSLVIMISILVQHAENSNQIATATLIMCMMSLCLLLKLEPYESTIDFVYAVASIFLLCVSTQVHGLGEARFFRSNIEDVAEFEMVRYTALFWIEVIAGVFLLAVETFMDYRQTIKKPLEKNQKPEQPSNVISLQINDDDGRNLKLQGNDILSNGQPSSGIESESSTGTKSSVRQMTEA